MFHFLQAGSIFIYHYDTELFSYEQFTWGRRQRSRQCCASSAAACHIWETVWSMTFASSPMCRVSSWSMLVVVARLILHDFVFELNMLSSDLFPGVFCVFIVFRSALCLILDWMIAIDWFFDLVSALNILRENQLPNKRPGHNLNFQQKSPRRHPLVIFETVKISLTHVFLQFHIVFLYLPKKHFTLHFSVKCNIS